MRFFSRPLLIEWNWISLEIDIYSYTYIHWLKQSSNFFESEGLKGHFFQIYISEVLSIIICISFLTLDFGILMQCFAMEFVFVCKHFKSSKTLRRRTRSTGMTTCTGPHTLKLNPITKKAWNTVWLNEHWYITSSTLFTI